MPKQPLKTNNETANDTDKKSVKKSRKRKQVDKKFSLNSEKRASSSKSVNPLNFRAEITPDKTSVLIGDALTPKGIEQAVLQKKLEENLAKTSANYRPLEKIQYKLNNDNQLTPVKGFTPKGKTPMERTGSLGGSGGIRFFKEAKAFRKKRNLFREFNAEVTPLVLPSTSAFYASDAYKAIKKVTTTYKLQRLNINNETRKKRTQERRRKLGKASRSQHSQVVQPGFNPSLGSATAYAEATELFTAKINVRWEWLHLVAHMILGESSQHENNLVVGEESLNTWMLLAEKEIQYLEKVYPEGFELEVRAQLISGTHIASSIHYFITTPDFPLPLTFDPNQLSEKPHRDFSEYLHAFVKTVVELTKDKKKENGPSQKSVKSIGEVIKDTDEENKPPTKRSKLSK